MAPFVMRNVFLCVIMVTLQLLNAQSVEVFRSGSAKDLQVNALGGICLMGGAAENDGATEWFLKQANGGDVLVIRTSGADGYNSYFYEDFGPIINSVTTIIFNDRNASSLDSVLRLADQAEAIWIAGGDQSSYVALWRSTPLANHINLAIKERSIAVGGTSAGMAILGNPYFTAEHGTIRSEEVLNNPFDDRITLDTTMFINVPLLDGLITDSHYDNPDRKGRHLGFIARANQDYSGENRGIACEEFTAICIDSSGIAKVYGEYPEYDDFAYFIRKNCNIQFNIPEILMENAPLTWDHNEAAVEAIRIQGTINGGFGFDLNTWESIGAADYYKWSVNEGDFFETESESADCIPLSAGNILEQNVLIFPNPSFGSIGIMALNSCYSLDVYNEIGQMVYHIDNHCDHSPLEIKNVRSGVYMLKIRTDSKIYILNQIVH